MVMTNTSGLTGLLSSDSYLMTPISLCGTVQLSFNYSAMSLNNLYNRFKLDTIMHDPLQAEERKKDCNFLHFLFVCWNVSRIAV
jgi:hypothetical protein